MLIEEIRDSFLEIKIKVNKEYQKFYHLNSIDCFLVNFYLIKDEEQKRKVLESLTECVNYYQNFKVDSISQSLKIFNEYLKPVGIIYEKEAGFWVLIKSWILFLYITIANFSIYFLSNKNIYFIIANSILLLFCAYLAKKYNSKKLYAFMW